LYLKTVQRLLFRLSDHNEAKDMIRQIYVQAATG